MTELGGDRRAFVVGTAGHVDHGKTALVRAMTGVETDRWREEKERGLSIDLGFAPLRVADGVEAGVVDVPGHEDFVKNMLAGATGVDVLLLVVAADEGPMPQTREHLTVARLLGVEEGVVALTKTDRVGEEWLALVGDAVREELRTVLGHARWPIVPVSSTEGTGVEELLRALGERASGISERPEDDLFRLPIDRSFTIRGAGTVVTGTLWSGSVEEGDEVRVMPGDRVCRVRSVEVHGEGRRRVSAGRRCALALVGTDPEEVPRGSVAVSDPSWRTLGRLGARIRVPGYAPRAVEDGQRVRVYLATREVMARIELERAGPVRGGEAWAVLELEDRVVARVGDRFVLRFYSPVTTIGGGRVADLDPPAGSWRDRRGEWEAVLEGGAEDALAAAAVLAGGEGLPVEDVPLAIGERASVARRVSENPPREVVRVEDRLFARDVRERLRSEAVRRLAAMHRERRRAPGISLQALREELSGEFAGELVDRELGVLASEGSLVTEGPLVRLPDHAPRLTPREEERMTELLRTITEGGFDPPTVSELAARPGWERDLLHDLLTLLEEEGRVEMVSPEIYLGAEAAAAAAARARRILREAPGAGPGRFKEEFGVSRKYLIPILEYLDRIGVSRRTGEGRVLAE